MHTKPLLLLLNYNQRNLDLLTIFLRKEGYPTATGRTLADLDQLLDRSLSIGCALLDIAGFNHAIWERCARLSSKKIPFVLISPISSPAIYQASISYGASSFMVKPLVVKDLLGTLANMLAATFVDDVADKEEPQ